MSWRVRVALVGDLDGHVEIHVHLLETSLSIRPSLSSLYEISGATGLDGGGAPDGGATRSGGRGDVWAGGDLVGAAVHAIVTRV